MSELEGQHALVTGGGTGIGAAIAVALAKAGAVVTITGRRQAPLETLAGSNKLISFVTGDVTNENDIARMFEIAGQRAPVSITIANAGIAESSPFDRTTSEQFERMMDVNLKGVFLTLREGYRCVKKSGFGRLLAISSIAGVKGYGYVAPYCASKHAVVGLVRGLAQETAGSGITVNAICPGYAETPMLDESVANIQKKTGMSRDEARNALAVNNPGGGFIQPCEVASAVLWLCGRGACSVTGQAIVISGGDP